MKEQFEGKLEQMNDFVIYLNIDQLKNGQYTLKLLQEKQIVMEINFEKAKLKNS